MHYGRRHEGGVGDPAAEIERVRDLRQRLDRGLRPEANPVAFWQVVAGLAYLGLGAVGIFLIT